MVQGGAKSTKLACAYGLCARGAEVLVKPFTGEIGARCREGGTVVAVYLR